MNKLAVCHKQGIIALIPTYIDMKGDGTKILTGDKTEHYVAKNIKRVIKILARKELLDLKESKKYYGGKLGCKNLVPIALNKETILIPIKTRKALSKNDSSFSYVNLKHIEEVIEDKRNAILLLKDQREIITRQRMITIKKHIRNGRLLEEIIDAEDNTRNTEIIREDDLFNQYNAPATKGDIMALRNELMSIKRKLNT